MISTQPPWYKPSLESHQSTDITQESAAIHIHQSDTLQLLIPFAAMAKLKR